MSAADRLSWDAPNCSLKERGSSFSLVAGFKTQPAYPPFERPTRLFFPARAQHTSSSQLWPAVFTPGIYLVAGYRPLRHKFWMPRPCCDLLNESSISTQRKKTTGHPRPKKNNSGISFLWNNPRNLELEIKTKYIYIKTKTIISMFKPN
jgi:hypothetical protein